VCVVWRARHSQGPGNSAHGRVECSVVSFLRDFDHLDRALGDSMLYSLRMACGSMLQSDEVARLGSSGMGVLAWFGGILGASSFSSGGFDNDQDLEAIDP